MRSAIQSLREAVSDLPPAYFALVMATGIVSIAAWLSGLKAVATGVL